MPRLQQHPPPHPPRRWRSRLAGWLRGFADNLDPSPFGLDLAGAPEVWADHVRQAARRAGRSARRDRRWRLGRRSLPGQPTSPQQVAPADQPGQPAGSPASEPGLPAPWRKPHRDEAGRRPPSQPPAVSQVEGGAPSARPAPPAQRPEGRPTAPLVRPRPTPPAESATPPEVADRQPSAPPRARPAPLVRPRLGSADTAKPPRTTPEPDPQPVPLLAGGHPEGPAARPVPPTDVVAQRSRRRPDSPLRPLPAPAPRHLLVEDDQPGTAPPAKGDPTRPAPGPWRVTPIPPYLPAAAVLADTMWPDLPARAPAPPAAAPPTLVLWRQARLDAEQGAT